ncbi:DUF2635 domain-containing protein [Roseomonas xinghualingensis]|uniref:DUF2635 domain-containing protein n=1 Tax=Roseomonas xinghualingensis TaxID=2986475 RepID=UPI0021F1C55D|nr:DUF2635 domain-containing protein [Roseomonas sp. SXEYE001]MCV4207569.1 DUF2635 domain-containing protein [Roseomonas sp. SXEYE001]
MYVKPAKGLQIPDPELGDFLPKEGRRVTPSEYWTRRILDKDVTEVDPPAEPKPEKAAEAPTTAPPAARPAKE